MKRSLGKMSKRSRLLRHRVSEPRLGITKLVKKFAIGDNVRLDYKSGYFGGMPHPRYRGKLGKVVAKRGEAYVVMVKVYSATKELIVPAVHLEKV
ncbi:50S ribosomal protein L21e [uncultured archaeon]|nr:50S ribosomal protein L21e [uncultured archaeon]